MPLFPLLFPSPPPLATLVDCLRSRFPRDVLMPVAKGTKQPMFKHKHGCWRWSDFDSFLGEVAKSRMDVCLVLHDLCVVDVDDRAMAAELEARFPELRTAPCATTVRGMHYYFTRPPCANELGYFDGCGQRVKGIDFKSLSQTGTGGIVMVPPSTGKVWVRHLADAVEGNSLQDVSLALLDAVAKPRMPAPPSATLVFHERDDSSGAVETTTTEMRDCSCLLSMSYFEPFFASDAQLDALDDGIPVPGSRAVFDELVHIIRHNSLHTRCPSRKLLTDVVELADMLGYNEAKLRKLRVRLAAGVPRFQLDMFEVNPAWWQAFADERARTGVWLVAVDEALAGALVYEGLARRRETETWLFDSASAQQRRRTHLDGDKMLHSDPVARLKAACPAQLLDFLSAFPNKACLAGGAVVGAVVRGVKPGHDFDVFVTGSEEDGNAIVRAAQSTFFRGCGRRRVFRTGNVVTWTFDDDHGDAVIVQVVLRLHDRPDDVLRCFDLLPCKVAAWFDGGDLAIKAAPGWVESVRRMAFPVDFSIWGEASVPRVMKYITKGFDAMVPGVRRSALKTEAVMQWARPQGLAELFFVEERVRCNIGKDVLPQFDDIKRLFYKRCYSDYGTFTKWHKRVVYVLKRLTQCGHSASSSSSATKKRERNEDDAADAVPLQHVPWSRCDVVDMRKNLFRPLSPMIHVGLDQIKLAEALLAM